ncbi:MAG: insulinase family protein [Bacteroidales bacterium]
MKTKAKILAIALINMFLFCIVADNAKAQKQYVYKTVPGDPLKARIYTFDNGLTVYMTVYKDAPRIQTAIAVKTGSKNDPSDNTGLSHYLEHMMFKGTDKYSTQDFSKEKPLLDKIDSMFEVYRGVKDTILRKMKYHIIDSLSGVAAKFAVANEYDKMMSAIGAKGTNAFTSEEETVYINDIPSNQVETWLTIEAERFRNPVFRLFHTELETVYEEKNMSLDNDDRKAWDSLTSGIFKKHPYGTQTTLGTVEHLKNPSIKTLREYYHSKYVPNNMAICISGDFDPEETIKLIDQKLGSLPKKDVKPFVAPVEDPISKPVIKEAFGPDAESMMLAFRLGGVNSKDADLLTIMDMILCNSHAGLIDLNLNQAQKVLQAGSYPDIMKDYSMHVLYGNPKQGQKLEDVKELLLSQVELVKKGNFPDWLIPAIINDLKLSEIEKEESNRSRAFSMVSAFIDDTPWSEIVNKVDRLSKITKQDIIDFANKNYGNNYAIVYKRTGGDKNVKKVQKPALTPVDVNRNVQSTFLTDIFARKPAEINPVFVDYDKDIKKISIKDSIQVYYNENKENKTFSLYYIFDMGSNNDKKLALAIDYLQYLGTSKLTPAEVQQELYKTGCSFSVSSSDDRVYVSLSGLSENFEKGLPLFENILADAQPNKEALDNLVKDILKKRADDKLSKNVIMWSAMYNYGKFGPKNPYTNILSEKELKSLKAEELVSLIKNLNSYQHYILYYGPSSTETLAPLLNMYHKVPATLKPLPAEIKFKELPSAENKIYVVGYDMKQVDIVMLSKSDKYDKTNVPAIRLFNEYFGAGMNSVVFQELRESKALAYSAYAGYSSPYRLDRSNYISSFIGTQNDKLPEAMKSMFDVINNMPESEKSFDAAKEAIIQKIRTERITKENILFNYMSAKRLELTYDIRKDVFEKVPSMKFSDLLAFQKKYLKDKKYTILVLGKKKDMDIKTLEKYGKIKYLKLDEVFGY